jgi:hypothetical protein
MCWQSVRQHFSALAIASSVNLNLGNSPLSGLILKNLLDEDDFLCITENPLYIDDSLDST